MELCTVQRKTSSLIQHCHKFSNPNASRLHPRPSLVVKITSSSSPSPRPSLLVKITPSSSSISQTRYPGFHHRSTSLLRATTSEETSVVIDEQKEGPDGVISMENGSSGEVNSTENKPSEEPDVPYETKPAEEVTKEERLTGEQMQAFEFLEGLNLKLDSEEAYQYLIYGGGAVVALWLASAVVGAIDSIPVIPKVLELVGLGFVVWFSSRYLLLKKNREELFDKIEDLKQEIIGPSDD